MKVKTEFLRKFFLLIAVLVGVLTYAQNITGEVKDNSGVPLPGVSVVVKGTTRGVETDFNGKYRIEAKKGEVLVFSFVGMKSKEIKISNQNYINVHLIENTQELTDVVVIGYGSGRKVGSQVSNVARVDAKEIAQRPSGNVVDALQGRVSGMQVFANSGEPSALSSIRLHGLASIGGSGSSPLFVVDGVPVAAEVTRSLNQSDIESISILKDASATSIYGSRAANGVVYITTKRGKVGKGEIAINTQYGVSNIAFSKIFGEMMNADELAQFWVDSGLRTEQQIKELREKYNSDTKWSDIFFKNNKPTYQADLSLSGGKEQTRYFISGGFFKQEGNMHRSGLERYTFRGNIETKVKDWLKVTLNTGVSFYEFSANPSTGANVGGGLAFLIAPFYSPVDKNGNRYDFIPGANRYHPDYLAEKSPFVTSNFDVIPSFTAELNITKNLTFKTILGMQFTNGKYVYTRFPSRIDSPKNGYREVETSSFIQKNITNTLDYKFNIRKNNFIVLLGQEAVSTSKKEVNAQGSGLVSDELILLSHTTANKKVNERDEFGITKSLFGRVEYNYNDTYFLDVTLRRDGSSKFSPNHQYGNFWSVGTMWKAKKETFLENVDWLNDLSLKLSAGTTGNSDIGYYTHQAFASKLTYNGETGYYFSAAGNPELTWEKQSKYMFTLNTRLFDRLNFDLELYRKITSDMLFDVPSAFTTGFEQVKRNIGKLQNDGVSVMLSADVLGKKSDFSLSPYVTFSYNREKVLELFGGRDSWIDPNSSLLYKVGAPITYIYPIYKGVNPQNGLPQWYVPGTDRTQTHTDDNNYVEGTKNFKSETLQQNTNQRYTVPVSGGFGLSASYKTLSLQLDFSYSYGKHLFDNTRYFSQNPTNFVGFNQTKAVRDFWKKPGDVTRFPKSGETFTQFDTSMLDDASFIRLKNLTIGYQLSEKALKGQDVFKKIRFYVTGRNLLTFTKYQGLDPESSSSFQMGINPSTKQYVFGVELNF